MALEAMCVPSQKPREEFLKEEGQSRQLASKCQTVKENKNGFNSIEGESDSNIS